MEWSEGVAFSVGGRGWVFPDAGVIFTRSQPTEPSIDDANGLIDFFLWLEKVDVLPSGRSPTIIHDWVSYDRIPQEVRALFSRRRKEIAAVPDRLIVALAINPVLRMALRTVALGTQLLTRAAPLEIVDDARPVLAKRGIESPDPLLHLRLREAWRAR